MPDLSDFNKSRFPNRPWARGYAAQILSNKTCLHMDAYVKPFSGHEHLLIDWREGGRKRVAVDAWLIEPDGLTPVWYGEKLLDQPLTFNTYWTPLNAAIMARVHKAVLAQCERFAHSRWARISILCHYVPVKDAEVWYGVNHYKEPKFRNPNGLKAKTLVEYEARKKNTLPDIL